MPEHAYASLTPDAVIDALVGIGLDPDGRLLTLNSYENRVFQVGLHEPLNGNAFVVAKFYRPGRWSDDQILEEHRFAHELAEADIPVVPPHALRGHTMHHAELHGHAHRFSVSLRRGGREPELDDPEVLAWIGRLMARLHTTGRRQRFAHRPTLSVQHLGRTAWHWLKEHGDLPDPQRQVWLAVADQALDLADQAFAQIDGLQMGRIHGDCHLGNVLWTPGGPHFVDLDDAFNGPAVQDLWMLLGGHRRDRQSALHALMDGYETVCDFDWREWRLVEPLRTLRLIHHSAWLARRWDDPAFPAAFPWFAQASYWQQQADQLRQQIEWMQQDLEHPMA